MKTTMMILGAIALFSSPAFAADTLIQFNKELVLKANEGLSEDALSTAFRTSDSVDVCQIKVLTPVGGHPVIEKGRKLIMENFSDDSGFRKLHDPESGKVVAQLRCFAGLSSSRTPLQMLKDSLGAEPADEGLERIPVNFEGPAQEEDSSVAI